MNKLLLIFLISSISFAGLVGGKNKAEVLESVKKASVDIRLYKSDLSHSTSTGFFLGNQGHIITSSHAIWPLVQDKKGEFVLSITDFEDKEILKVEVVSCESPKVLDLCVLVSKDYKPKHYFKYEDFKIGKGNHIAHIGHCEQTYSLKEGKIKDKVNNLSDHYTSDVGNHSAYVFEGDYGACPGDSGAAMFAIDGISKKRAKLLGIITGGRTKEVWDKKAKKYKVKYSYKYAIDASEIKKLFKKEKLQFRDISSVMIKSKKSKFVEKLENAKKSRNVIDYTNVLFGVDAEQ